MIAVAVALVICVIAGYAAIRALRNRVAVLEAVKPTLSEQAAWEAAVRAVLAKA